MNVRIATALAATTLLGALVALVPAAAQAGPERPEITHRARVDHSYRMEGDYVMSRRHALETAWWRMGSPR